jgi:hypothetical protein
MFERRKIWQPCTQVGAAAPKEPFLTENFLIAHSAAFFNCRPKKCFFVIRENDDEKRSRGGTAPRRELRPVFNNVSLPLDTLS